MLLLQRNSVCVFMGHVSCEKNLKLLFQFSIYIPVGTEYVYIYRLAKMPSCELILKL